MSTEFAEGSKYNSWTVLQLKNECRRRSLPLVGRKAELIDRLLNSDRYEFLDQYVEDHVEQEMDLPDESLYRDMSASSILPDITDIHIDVFLARFRKKDDAGKRLYEAEFLLFIRSVCVEDRVYFKAQCHAEMRDMTYFVDVIVMMDGHIHQSHCECAVGSGTIAHCKHVIAVLYGITDMKVTGELKLHRSCTQKLQSFHRPKKTFKGSPLKAPALVPGYSTEYSAVSPRFKTEPYEIRKKKYQDRVRNLLFSKVNLASPLQQRYEPANPFAVLQDHGSYCVESQVDVLMKRLGLKDVDQEHIDKVEAATRGQRNSHRWREERRCRITASNFKRVCRAKPESWPKLSRDLIHPPTFSSAATEHGIENEQRAIRKYAEDRDLDVRSCGMFISPETPFLASSPDGLLHEETFIEVKCPFSARGKKIAEAGLDYLKKDVDGGYFLDYDHAYYYQIQGQFYTTGRKYCNLVIFTGEDLIDIPVWRNDEKICDIVSKCVAFYDTHHKHEIVKEFLLGGLSRYEKLRCRCK